MSLIKINDLFHFEKGSLQSSKCTPGEFDFITASSEWKTHTEYTHDCEALIFAAAASGSLGRTHYVHGKFISSDLCFIITPKDPINYPIDLKFYHLIFQAFKDEIVRNTKAGTSKEAIGLTAFGKYELPYFGIKKQQEVKEQFVKAQESTFGLNNEFSNQLSLVKQLRQAFLREAMQGKLVPQDPNDEPASVLLEKIKAEKELLIKEKKIKKEKPLPPISEEEIPFEIPENWVWCRLGEMFDVERGSSPRPKGDPRYFSKVKTPFHWITISDMTAYAQDKPLSDTREFLTELGTKHSRYVTTKDIIIVASGSAGRTSLLGIDGYIYDGLMSVKNVPDESMKHFLFYLFKIFEANMMKLATGATWQNINTDILKNQPVPIPPLSEQKRIVAKLDELMLMCDDLEESIKESQQQNEALLQQVLQEALEVR